MPDHVYLSLWLKRWDHHTVLEALRKILEVFPYSPARPGIQAITVQPIDWSEPPALEEQYAEGADAATALAALREFAHSDCAFQATAFWEVGKQTLPVTVIAYGPDFTGRDEERGHLELDLGFEAHYLEAQQNVTQLVFLMSALRDSLPTERWRLWSESGEDFVDRLASHFGGGS
jgi:hypothetical protein